ncbi:MAG: orotate phosphoribosyltransferase [Planctomycetota bacterium]
MEAYQRDFIDFLVRSEVLLFGDFVTKSGRRTPYFVNTGRFRTGAQLERLGAWYAEAIASRFGLGFDALFGPAYKGVPLAVSAGIALARGHGKDAGVLFNRKEAKDHGEGGTLVGYEPQDGDRVVIVEDVTTAGTSIRETVPLLRAQADVRLAGLIVAVDRGERGPSGTGTALAEVGREHDMPVAAIVTVHDILAHLTGRELDGRVVLDDAARERMDAYLAEYAPRGADGP